MQPEAPAQKPRRYRHLVRWSFIVILAILGWYGWKAYDFQQAVKRAEELGWRFEYPGPIDYIRTDWKNAFRKGTWKSASRDLYLDADDEIEGHFDLVRRLNPTQIGIDNTFSGRDLSGFKGLSNLTELWLNQCPNLANIDALKDMKSLIGLRISEAPSLLSIDALKELKTLRDLDLSSCYALTSVDPVRELNALESLDLDHCKRLTKVDGLLALPKLGFVSIHGCTGLSKDEIARLKKAIPRVNEHFSGY